MAEILNIDEIKSRYDGEWVLIGDPVADESLTVVRGSVLWHSKDRDEVYCKARELKPVHSAILFFGHLPKTPLSSYDLWLRSEPRSDHCACAFIRSGWRYDCTLGFGHRGYKHIDKLGNLGPPRIRSSTIARPNSGDHWKRVELCPRVTVQRLEALGKSSTISPSSPTPFRQRPKWTVYSVWTSFAVFRSA